jgi:hypothetical protein
MVMVKSCIQKFYISLILGYTKEIMNNKPRILGNGISGQHLIFFVLSLPACILLMKPAVKRNKENLTFTKESCAGLFFPLWTAGILNLPSVHKVKERLTSTGFFSKI